MSAPSGQAGHFQVATFGRLPALVHAGWLVLACAAQAQTPACEQLKARLDERIAASGVRGHALDAVAAATPLPQGGKVIGTCEGGAYKVVYRRFGGAPLTATVADSPATAASPRPLPKATPPPVQARASAASATTRSAAAAAKKAGTTTPNPVVVEALPVFDADAAVARLREISLRFEAPAAMVLGEKVTVRLVADSPESIDALQRAVDVAGDRATPRRLTADLSGAGFRLTAATPADPGAAPAWDWQVEPMTAGEQGLSLVWAVEFIVDGKPLVRELRTFTQPVSVRRPFGQRITDWIGQRSPWLLALLLLPVLVGRWAWQSRHGAYDKSGLPRGPKIGI